MAWWRGAGLLKFSAIVNTVDDHYDAGGTSNYSWYRVGGDFSPPSWRKYILTLALHLSRVRGQPNLFVLLHILAARCAIHIQGDDGTALGISGHRVYYAVCGRAVHWLAAGGLAAGIVGGAALLARYAPGFKGLPVPFWRCRRRTIPRWRHHLPAEQGSAIGTGGLTGRGFLGEHILERMERFSPYLANVLGFAGAAAVLVLLLALCPRTLQTGCAAPDALGCNICVGIFAALFCSALSIFGMNFTGAAGHRRDAAVLLGRRVDRQPLHRHCAERGMNTRPSWIQRII